MRTINLVMVACVLAGGLFLVYNQWIAAPSSPQNLGPFLESVNNEIVQAAAEGRGITLVIGDSKASGNPLLLTKQIGGIWARILGGKGDNEFVFRLGKAGYPLGWNPTVRLDPGNKKLLEPFARMLMKATEAGVPVKILAQGESVAFVLHAADSAGAPVIERIVGAGVRLGDLKARWPKSKKTFDRQEVIGDRILVWIDPVAVPRSLNVEGSDLTFERDPGYADWEKILIRALEGGASALKPREARKSQARPFRNQTGRAFKKTGTPKRSGLDWLKKDPRMARDDSENETALATVKSGNVHHIGYSGWTITKDFKDSTYMEPRGGGGALFGRQPHMVTLLTSASDSTTGKHRTAGDYCYEFKRPIKKTTFEGYPAVICSRFPMPEDSRPQAHHDVITILDGSTDITVKYTYDTLTDRDGGLQLFHNVLGALKKEKDSGT